MALAGYRMHVVTVNGYLAERDAADMAPLYRMLGISAGAVTHETPREERRTIYRRSVVYCDNKELAFDYLRDRVAVGRRGSQLHRALDRLHDSEAEADTLTLSGLEFAIVDEADSVFIDEARTPLILSAAKGPAVADPVYASALGIARSLTAWGGLPDGHGRAPHPADGGGGGQDRVGRKPVGRGMAVRPRARGNGHPGRSRR